MMRTFFIVLSFASACTRADSLAEETFSDVMTGSELIAALEQRVTLPNQGKADEVDGRFQQRKFIAILPQPLLSDGEFHYASSTGLTWKTLNPIESLLVLDQQGIRQNVEGETVWEIDAQQPAVVTITQVMSGLLASDWHVLQDYFRMAGTVNGDEWQLQLIPTDAGLQSIVTEMRVAGGRQVQQLVMLESNSDRTEIDFQFAGKP